MTYVFDPTTPPLFRRGFHPNTVAEEQRSSRIGIARWNEVSEEIKDDVPFEMLVIITRKSFVVTRTQLWVPRELIHYAVDAKVKLEYTEGYSQEEHRKFERTLDVGASVGLTLLNLKADVKSSLKITNEITNKWFVEKKNTIDRDYKGGYTYVKWSLIERFDVEKTSSWELHFRDDDRILESGGPAVENSNLTCSLSEYEDSIQDPSEEIFHFLQSDL
ncbi:hypothetical protein [Mesorhizobium sp.]|uniref:hypothetical protein n=1 Tax=Mesorhizobium sp. TaxID=1871066 RepID=UPI000FE68432|nr:hypothetical protein [Mesorhizobium sp.]RWE86936.1 MAG: hypothetical protein EOS49_11775 [Mesorhizobium sp.]